MQNMIQTLEAVVDEQGNVSLLSKLRLNESRRALVTILDEASNAPNGQNFAKATDRPVSDEDVLSVWANRKESAKDIARGIRENNRKTT